MVSREQNKRMISNEAERDCFRPILIERQIELLRLVKDILLPSHIATKKKEKVKKAGLNNDSEGSIKNEGNKKPEKKKKSAKISKKLGSISSFHSSVNPWSSFDAKFDF